MSSPGLTIVVSTGSGAPELPDLKGFIWATPSPGVINAETWSSSCFLGEGLTTYPSKTSHVKKPEE
jgi:hypothetical protein